MVEVVMVEEASDVTVAKGMGNVALVRIVAMMATDTVAMKEKPENDGTAPAVEADRARVPRAREVTTEPTKAAEKVAFEEEEAAIGRHSLSILGMLGGCSSRGHS